MKEKSFTDKVYYSASFLVIFFMINGYTIGWYYNHVGGVSGSPDSKAPHDVLKKGEYFEYTLHSDLYTIDLKYEIAGRNGKDFVVYGTVKRDNLPVEISPKIYVYKDAPLITEEKFTVSGTTLKPMTSTYTSEIWDKYLRHPAMYYVDNEPHMGGRWAYYTPEGRIGLAESVGTEEIIGRECTVFEVKLADIVYSHPERLCVGSLPLTLKYEGHTSGGNDLKLILTGYGS